MESSSATQKQHDVLGIQKLISLLHAGALKKTHFNAEDVQAIFRSVRSEIPYAAAILPLSLSSSLYEDAPQIQNDLSLNTVVMDLAHSFFDPSKKAELSEEIQTYLYTRKMTEMEYSNALLDKIWTPEIVLPFPEKEHTVLKQLALYVIEKIIAEKQLRSMSHYKAKALIDLIEPIIYDRLYHFDFERIRSAYFYPFRKLVNTIAQKSYEQIQDIRLLMQISQEKAEAFNTLAEVVHQHLPSADEIKSLHAIHQFLQRDRQAILSRLDKKLRAFLPPLPQTTAKGILYQQLHARMTNKLIKLLYQAEQSAEIYQSKQHIQKAHQDAYRIVEQDADAFQKLLNSIASIQKKYTEHFIRRFTGTKEFNAIDEALLPILLGKIVTKKNLVSLETFTVREGGYPQRHFVDMYRQTSISLKNISEQFTGVFSAHLKAEVTRACKELVAARDELAQPVSAITEITAESLHAEPAVVIEPVIEKEIVEPVKPKPLLPEVEAVKPIAPEPLLPTEKEVAETVTPLLPVEEELVKPVAPKPLLPVEEVIEPIKPEDAVIEPITLEPVLKATPPEEKISYPPALQPAVDVGLAIMKNYQLKEFEQPVYRAWIKMISSTAESTEAGAGLGMFQSENEVNLYVICDLSQQIAAVDASTLNEPQKAELQTIRGMVLKALEDPLSPANWDCFEGNQRDFIDRVLLFPSQP